jgi:hypothetical protein
MSAAEQQKETPYGRPINDIIRDLSKPVPERLLKDKTVGGRKIDFIPWYNATRLLDFYAPGWEYTVRLEHIKDKVVAIASISIHAAEGVITREATGSEEDDKSGYGDPFSNAESMALRRAAAKFGLGRHLYDTHK